MCMANGGSSSTTSKPITRPWPKLPGLRSAPPQDHHAHLFQNAMRPSASKRASTTGSSFTIHMISTFPSPSTASSSPLLVLATMVPLSSPHIRSKSWAQTQRLSKINPGRKGCFKLQTCCYKKPKFRSTKKSNLVRSLHALEDRKLPSLISG